MIKEFAEMREEVEKIYSSGFISRLKYEIDEHLKFINKISDLIKLHFIDLKDIAGNEKNIYDDIHSYNLKLLKFLESRPAKTDKPELAKDFPDFFDAYNNFISTKDVKRFETQDPDRFNSVETDSALTKFLKLNKKSAYFFTTSPQRISNRTRKIFHKPEQSLKIWKRKIYFRSFLQNYLRNNLVAKSLELVREVNKKNTASMKMIWDAEEKINKHFTSGLNSLSSSELLPDEMTVEKINAEFDSANKLLQSTKADLQKKSAAIINEIFTELDELYPKAGTFELPSYKFNEVKVEKTFNDLSGKYSSVKSGWQNAEFALLDDWRLNKDVYLNEILEVKELCSLKSESHKKLNEKIIPGVEQIKNILQQSVRKIEAQNNLIKSENILSEERAFLKSNLNKKLIPGTIDLLLNEEIPQSIDQLEFNLKQNISLTSKRRAIVKTEEYDKEIRDSDIEFTEPSELIRFEILPEFIRNISKLKASIVEQIDDLQKKIINIDEIADFNLESAIAASESVTKKNSENGDPVHVALEGLNRAISKSDEVKTQLLDVQNQIINSTSDIIGNFNEKLLKLTNSDNILEIRLRIAKAKAIQKTKQFRSKVIQSLKDIFPQVLNLFKRIFVESGNLYKNLRVKFGLERKKVKISAEISDFLAETESAINKLPYVYQRLFKIEPLEDT